MKEGANTVNEDNRKKRIDAAEPMQSAWAVSES